MSGIPRNRKCNVCNRKLSNHYIEDKSEVLVTENDFNSRFFCHWFKDNSFEVHEIGDFCSDRCFKVKYNAIMADKLNKTLESRKKMLYNKRRKAE